MARDERRSQQVAGAETGYWAFALEEAEDGRRTRVAVAGAVLFHAVLFVLPLGFLEPETVSAEAPPQKVFVIQPVRFEPPPPEPTPTIPEAPRRRVPIPDPRPDDPEPLRIDEEIPQPFDLPDIDLVANIPAAPPPIARDEIIQVGGAVTRPVKISGPKPAYTELARRARIQGVVIVEAIIDKEGNVQNVSVLKPLPMGLDRSAADAVSQWKFEPATLNGEPVDVYYNLSVNFRLQQ